MLNGCVHVAEQPAELAYASAPDPKSSKKDANSGLEAIRCVWTKSCNTTTSMGKRCWKYEIKPAGRGPNKICGFHDEKVVRRPKLTGRMQTIESKVQGMVDVENWQATNLNFGSKIMVVAEVHRGHKNTRLKLRQTSNKSDIKKTAVDMPALVPNDAHQITK